MRYDVVLLRYGELALKGKNRGQFENRLLANVRQALADFPGLRVRRAYGRLLVELGDAPFAEVAERLGRVFGLVSFSPAVRTPLDLPAIQEAALALIRSLSPAPRTFKVAARRSVKNFPHTSHELNHLVGAHVLRNTDNLTVDVHEPDVELAVEVRPEGAFLYVESLPGPGGLPVGVSGKVLLLLSGGIDSPVAGWRMLKRGVTLEAIHFHSYPFTSEQALEKVRDLARVLSRYGGPIRLHVVPFTEIQTRIRQHVPETYGITIMRRFMMRIAQGIAEKRRALALATGESLGQVASQTLESINTINRVVTIPILRPLIGMDKAEIMETAKAIGTYEISIRPYEDCCTIFVPKNPKTKPDPEEAAELEAALPVDELVADAIARTEMETLDWRARDEIADLL